MNGLAGTLARTNAVMPGKPRAFAHFFVFLAVRGAVPCDWVGDSQNRDRVCGLSLFLLGSIVSLWRMWNERGESEREIPATQISVLPKKWRSWSAARAMMTRPRSAHCDGGRRGARLPMTTPRRRSSICLIFQPRSPPRVSGPRSRSRPSTAKIVRSDEAPCP